MTTFLQLSLLLFFHATLCQVTHGPREIFFLSMIWAKLGIRVISWSASEGDVLNALGVSNVHSREPIYRPVVTVDVYAFGDSLYFALLAAMLQL